MSETAASALPTEEEYRRYDRVWQRVSPSLTPYPRLRAAAEPGGAQAPEPVSPRVGGAGRGEAETIRGLLCDELAEAQSYRALAQIAPSAEGRRLMRCLASAEAAHAGELRAALFLLTGETCGVTVVLPPQPRLLWRDLLRERYRAEVAGVHAYERAATEAADACRRELFAGLAREECRHAGQLRRLVAKTL